MLYPHTIPQGSVGSRCKRYTTDTQWNRLFIHLFKSWAHYNSYTWISTYSGRDTAFKAATGNKKWSGLGDHFYDLFFCIYIIMCISLLYFVCVCMYVCIHLHSHTHTHIYIYICVCVCTYIHTYIHTYMLMSVCAQRTLELRLRVWQ